MLPLTLIAIGPLVVPCSLVFFAVFSRTGWTVVIVVSLVCLAATRNILMIHQSS